MRRSRDLRSDASAAKPGDGDRDNLGVLVPHFGAAHPLAYGLGRGGRSAQARERLGLNLTAGAALTDDAHKKVTEAIVELLDVSEHAHGRMAEGRLPRPCSTRRPAGLVDHRPVW